MKKFIVAVLVFALVAPGYVRANGDKWEERSDWSRYFEAANAQGCFLLYDLQKNKYFSFNRPRVNTGFVPASTYKIINSLIALDTGAVRDENEVIKWDGVKRMYATWDRDHNMREAIKNSTVWFYQELARRIGQDRMQHYVNAASYGNQNIGGGIDHFWLDGDLRITAKQQIDFLVKLHRNQVPFSPRAIGIVKDILINEKTDKYVLRAKTGRAGLGKPSVPKIGWWVGYVEREGKAYFFAMNIDTKDDEAPAKRITISKQILREMKIID